MPESKVLQPGSRTVDYYTTDLTNRPARMAIKKAGAITRVRRYPNGSLLVKENYSKDKKLTGIAAMLKLAGYDPADRNWVMAAYGPTGKVLAFGKVGSCISCHVMVRKQDLVFAPPPAQLLSTSIWKTFFPKQNITPVYDKLLKTHPRSIVQ
ncbi:MAG: cytochrome P460 family protein [Acidiferrobacteraceae bacterium]